MKVILPTAPLRKVTINMGHESTSWFDIKDFNMTGGGKFENVLTKIIIKLVCEHQRNRRFFKLCQLDNC